MITPAAPHFAIVSSPINRWSAAAPLKAGAATELSHSLRPSAIVADAGTTSDISLAVVWHELARGKYRIVDGFFSETRCYLVLSLETNRRRPPLVGRRLEILQAVLGGLRQKNVALDSRLAPSTVALNARLALESLGVLDKPSRVHPLLMLAARAAAEATLVVARYSTQADEANGELRVISTPRPDLALATLLPEAELAVICSLVEGRSYQEIARQRGTSTRTVANQISAVFRRLRVSGRNELVQKLAGELLARPASEPPRKTLVPPPRTEPGLDGIHARRRSA